MAKITIEELYRGEKYDIMSAVTVKAFQLGIGNAFDSVVSLVAYVFLLKKEKINILKD